MQPVWLDHMPGLVLLRDLGQPPRLFLVGSAQPLPQQGGPVWGGSREAPLDAGDRVRVIRCSPAAFGLESAAHLGGEHGTPGNRGRVHQPVGVTDRLK